LKFDLFLHSFNLLDRFTECSLHHYRNTATTPHPLLVKHETKQP